MARKAGWKTVELRCRDIVLDNAVPSQEFLNHVLDLRGNEADSSPDSGTAREEISGKRKKRESKSVSKIPSNRFDSFIDSTASRARSTDSPPSRSVSSKTSIDT